jgi:phage terminase Nu1 subunit (DNA packaging protein)
MAKTPAYDKERLAYINQLMEGIHESCNDIYESLVDRDFDSLEVEVNNLMSTLKDIKDSLGDEE